MKKVSTVVVKQGRNIWQQQLTIGAIISWHIADGRTTRVTLANNEYQVCAFSF